MNQFLTFVVNHWVLWSLFVLIVITLIVYQIQLQVGGIKKVNPHELVRLMNKDDAFVLDVRTLDIFKSGHILGAKNIPANEVHQKLAVLEKYKERPIIIVDAAGQSYLKTGVMLHKEGFMQVSYLAGGMGAWKTANLPVKQGKD
jgi:rhodanese-related sulfurtransferase